MHSLNQFFILYGAGALCQEISKLKLGSYEYKCIVYLQAMASFFPYATDLRILKFFATKYNRSRKTFLKCKTILYLYVSLGSKFKQN